MRTAEIIRKTKETDVVLYLSLDGSGQSVIDSGCGFLDHMLTLFAVHGDFDLNLKCVGDTAVDYHHTVEDIGICLGRAFKKAVGDKKGIKRYGSKAIPMDEALNLVSIDISGRSYLNFDVFIPCEKVGDFDTELTEEFFSAFVREAEITLHVVQMAGSNSHHIIEGVFKAFARAIKEAVEIDSKNADKLPSSKGVL
ncbi:MAG: imidazoleglycerol-phosphate dehydratase HisB [Christensenellaceae bacterium]